MENYVLLAGFSWSYVEIRKERYAWLSCCYVWIPAKLYKYTGFLLNLCVAQLGMCAALQYLYRYGAARYALVTLFCNAVLYTAARD